MIYLKIQATPQNTYVEMLTKSAFVSPGTYSIIHMSVTKTFTTDDAKAKDPGIRNCLFPDEYALKHFSTYTQTNCYINRAIEEFQSQCGCLGKYRGKLKRYLKSS